MDKRSQRKLLKYFAVTTEDFLVSEPQGPRPKGSMSQVIPTERKPQPAGTVHPGLHSSQIARLAGRAHLPQPTLIHQAPALGAPTLQSQDYKNCLKCSQRPTPCVTLGRVSQKACSASLQTFSSHALLLTHPCCRSSLHLSYHAPILLPKLLQTQKRGRLLPSTLYSQRQCQCNVSSLWRLKYVERMHAKVPCVSGSRP